MCGINAAVVGDSGIDGGDKPELLLERQPTIYTCPERESFLKTSKEPPLPEFNQIDLYAKI